MRDLALSAEGILQEKIHSRQARVAILGLGYVGLPLAIEFARAGFRVLGFDVDASRVENVNAARSYVQDVPQAVLGGFVQAERLRATHDFDELAAMDAVSICVPTPLRKSKDPDISYIVNATREIRRTLHRGQLVILESTTYPGTTDEVMLPELEASGLKVGEDFFLAFSPERVDPGNPRFGTKNTPKIIGGVTPRCGQMARCLYETAIEKVVSVSSTKSAEMVKLLENTFRAVNIGLVNEVAIICDKLGVDVWEVIEAAATKPFGFMPFFPGPGLGGHCIPIDPHYLAWKLKLLDYNARFIELAGEVNSSMPHYVVDKVARALNRCRKPLNGSCILVLGVAYKRNVGDTRESPALDIIKMLRDEGAQVCYHDPYVPMLDHELFKLSSVELDRTRLEGSDCVVIVTDHECTDWKLVAAHSPLVVDTRNALRGRNAKIIRL